MSYDTYQEVPTSLMTSYDLLDGHFSINGYPQESLVSVDGKWTRSIDGLDDLLRSLESNKSDHPDIGEGATFTSCSSLSLLPSQDSFVGDHAGQANQPKSQTSWNRPVHFEQMFSINGHLQEGLGSVDVKWTSIDGVDSISFSLESNKSDHPDIGEGARFTSNSSLRFLMNFPMLPSQDSYVGDQAGQGNHLKPETSWKPSIQLVRMYADTLNPETVQTAATNPVSGPSMELNAETTDNDNPSGIEQTNKTYVEEPNDHDVLFGKGSFTNEHPGNKEYRKVASTLRQEYKAADKVKKAEIAKHLVKAFRFLKQDKKTNRWYVVKGKDPLEKARQLLREDPDRRNEARREDRKRNAQNKASQDSPESQQATKRAKNTVVSQMK